MRFFRVLTITVFIFCMLCFLQTEAFATAISPGSIDIKNALRGREFKRSLTVYNTNKSTITYRFRPKVKPVSDWIKVYDVKTNKPIDTIKIKGKTSKLVIVHIKLPKDIANGDYSGFLRVVPEQQDKKKEKININVTLVPSVIINVQATDKQVIDAQVTNFIVNDTEVDVPLDIGVGVHNKSNVEIAPNLSITIYKGEEAIKKATFQMKMIGLKMTSNETFSIGLDNPALGKYKAQGIVSFQKVDSKPMQKYFEIVKPGTFSKASMKDFFIKGSKKVGETISLNAVFSSQSPKKLKTKFVADIYLDGLKIGSVESKERDINPYRVFSFKEPFKIQKPGDYKIDAYFTFNTKESNHKAETFNTSSNILYYIIGGILVVIIIILIVVGAYLFRRPSRGSRGTIDYETAV